MVYSYKVHNLEVHYRNIVKMVFFSKAKKGALKREATKRKSENLLCASVEPCDGSSVVLDFETESDEDYDDLLDAISIISESESETSFNGAGGCECCGFGSRDIEDDTSECLELHQTKSMSSSNVWETFNTATISELRNISMVSSDFDSFDFIEDSAKLEDDVCHGEVVENIEEKVPDHIMVKEIEADNDEELNDYFPCTEGCCASFESLTSDPSHHNLDIQYCCNDDPMEGSSESVFHTQALESEKLALIENTSCDSKRPKMTSSEEKSPIVDTHEYSQDIDPTWFNVEGRRIVDWNYMCKCLLEAQRTHSRTCSGLLCMRDEKYRSMISVMILQCNVCQVKFKVRSEEPSEKPQLRRSMVWATLCSGGTYNSTKELLTFCNIPFMPFITFISDEMNMDPILEDLLEKSYHRAVKEEEQHTEHNSENPDVTSENQSSPVKLAVALDGSWGTRSYGKRFNAASGCGVIIGEKSKKILFAGCRNKRCSVCDRATRLKKDTIPTHRCFKNYVGSSGSMESHIMIEGFQKLMKDGIWLTTITTDGDSTTVAKLKNAVKYGASIQHQLCCNHVTKNCGKKLREIKYPKEVADIVSKNLERITFGIRSAIKHCAEESNGKDVAGLRLDIQNVPSHVFGNHDNCRNYFCSKQTSVDENYTVQLEKCGVLTKIQKVVDSVAAKAEFLNYNKTSNPAENVFSRLCKFSVGKRLNIMSRGSYQRRVWITVLQHNEGYEWHYEGLKIFAACTPGSFLEKMVENREKLKEATLKTKSRPEYSRKPAKVTEIDRDYGPNAIEAAERIEKFESLEVDVVKMYSLSQSSREKIKTNLTIPELEEFAKGRILSRTVADIALSTPKTLSQKCENLLLTTNTWNYIKQNRAIIGPVTLHLKNNHGYEMGGSRIFIDECHSYLCCIPDGVSNDAILMVKKKAVAGFIRDHASSNKGGMGCKITGDEIILDRKTYCEVQIALHICKMDKVVYVFANSNDLSDYFVKEVFKDDSYFAEKIEDKIVDFINKYLLRKVTEDDVFIKC